MTKKTLIVLIILISFLTIGTLAVDLLRSSKRTVLPSSIDSSHSAIAVDMHLESGLVTTNDVLDGRDPVMVLVTPNQNPRLSPSIHVIRNISELAILDVTKDHMLNQLDPTYHNLAVAYLPKQKTFNFFTKTETEKIQIVPLSAIGIRSIVLDEQWAGVREADITHPNFENADTVALMADNSKRPMAIINLPANIIADIENPEKVLLTQPKLNR